jgi:hypothetical protein
MKKVIDFIKQNKGVISMEMILYSVFILTLVWIIFEFTSNIRFRNVLNNSAATISEIMVNQKIPEADDEDMDEYEIKTLTELIEAELDSGVALTMLSDMLMPEGVNENTQLGMKVTYLDTTQVDNDIFYKFTKETGLVCQSVKKDTVETPDLQVFANKLKINGVVADTKVVMIEVCAQTDEKKLSKWVMPNKFYSYFISTNKD